MLRRVHVPAVHSGQLDLEQAEAHHIRDVLRLTVGSPLQLFDAAGRTAMATIATMNSTRIVVNVETISEASAKHLHLTVASAIPKGDRADWMIEKLAELGVDRFVPLITQRSVVHPSGRNKFERWERSAMEAAKQSRRSGIMEIAGLMELDAAISETKAGCYLSTAADASPARSVFEESTASERTLFIGPEGGWTGAEMAQMKSAGFMAVALTDTVLRVETAAVVAAGLVLCLANES